MFLELLAISGLSYVLWSLSALVRVYRSAKPMGIPLIVVPIDPLNVPWQVVQPHFWAIVDYLHIPVPHNLQPLRRGFGNFKAKADVSIRLGPVYAFCTPRRVIMMLCDPDAAHHMFTHRHDFPRPPENYELLAVYGPSISTASPENWARHRKVLATAFMNEKIMESVWDESLVQTRQMIEGWTVGTPNVGDDTRTISLNILAAIGFRQSFKFRNEKEVIESNGRFSYRDALQIVLENIILILLIPRKHLQYSWLPANLRRIGKAAADFGMHMQQMVDTELSRMNQGEKGNGSLITSFVQAIDLHQKDPTKGMSVDELLGNLFVINFAGHDTTANTLAYAVLLLAANPDVQEWVAEEITRETAGLSEEDLDYNALYPKLVRCRSIMLETLRLFPPIMSLPKRTLEPKVLPINGREIVIPPDTIIYAQTLATQTHPQFWPDAPREWKPSRWVTKNDTGSSGIETIVTPARETYFPWSDGPQNCPGMKFSQVEFVAVMLSLLREHRVSGVRECNESEETRNKRVKAVVEDSDAIMLLKMNNPERAQLRLRRVGDE